MNILMLGRWVPPPRYPLKSTREYQLGRYLARAHRLTLSFATDNANASGPISALRSEFGDLEFAVVPRGWKSLAGAVSLATGDSCTLSYFRSEALTRRLSDRLRTSRYDLAYISSSAMIQYGLALGPEVPIVMDFGGVDSEWWLRQAAQRSFASARFFRTEAARLRAAETTIAQRAARCVVATREAAEVVETLAPGIPISLVPDGVGVEPVRGPARTVLPPVVVFSTPLHGARNLQDVTEFCRDIVPLVSAAVPDCRFVIVSRDQPPHIGQLALPASVRLVVGVADVRPTLRRAVVAVAPVRNAAAHPATVLDPMAAALPVVATAGACAGLRLEPGRHLHVADDPALFAKRVVELLTSASSREEMAAGGRSFVETEGSWEVMGSRISEMIAGMVKASGGGPPASLPSLALGA